MRTEHTSHNLPAFPIWSAGFVSDTRLVLGGGGGTGRTGVKNKIRLYEVVGMGKELKLLSENELERDEDAPMSMAVNIPDSSLICGINASSEKMLKGENEHCRLYSAKDDQISLVRSTQIIRTDDPEVYQHATAFSKDNKLVAIGSKDHRVTLLAYPSLVPVAATFKIPNGKLWAVDFSESHLLITTDTTLYLVALPIVLESEPATETIALPELDVEDTVGLPSRDALGLGSADEGSVLTFRAGRFNPQNRKRMYTVVNSAPPVSRSRSLPKIERKSFIVKWEYVVPAEGDEKKTGTWKVKKVRHVGKRLITVFDVSVNGLLLAYGASDFSVGVLDTKTLGPLLTILKAHEFPPVALQFNPSSSVLVSGGVDANVRVIVMPERIATTSWTTLVVSILLALLVLVAGILVQRSL